MTLTTAHTQYGHEVQEISIIPEDQSGLTVYRVVIECECGATLRCNADRPDAKFAIDDAVARHRRAQSGALQAFGMLYVGVD